MGRLTEAKRERKSKKPTQGRDKTRFLQGPPIPLPSSRRLVFSGSIILACACCLVAAYLMYSNLSYGLPLYYHGDEPYKAVSAVELARGSVPSRFNHPQFMLFFSVPFLRVGASLAVHPLLAARAAVATLGVATVFLLFLVGKSLAGRMTGFAAALFYATAPLAVVAAHDFKEDIPLAFWLTVQLLFMVRHLRGARSSDLFLAAVALGGAMGTKYTGLIGAPLLVGSVFLGPARDRWWKLLPITALLATGGFLLSTPSILWYPGEFLAGLSFEAQHAILGHGLQKSPEVAAGYSATSGSPLRISPIAYVWTYHLRYSLVPGISIGGVLLALVGAFMAVTRGDRAWRLVASGMVLFYMLLESLPLKPPPFAARYMVVVLPYAALLGGGALASAWQGGRLSRTAMILLCAATIGFNGFRSFQQVEAMRPDTRDEARAWIFRNVPQGARLIIPGMIWYTPFAGSFNEPDFPYDIAALQEPSFSELLTASLDPQAYLVVSSFNFQRYLDHPGFNPDASRFYRHLFERYTPLATFTVPFRPLGFHNPKIEIFRLSDAATTPASVR